jgi:3-hydroxyethyl bacteriochlorophyllide a dehydrogenase
MTEPSWQNEPSSLPAAGTAFVIEGPGQVAVRQLRLHAPGSNDLVVDVAYSGVSSGTEKLLFTGEMPPFPGMGYPLVPGYEAVGDVLWAGPDSSFVPGDRVFVPGANCFENARGLFGATASTLVVPAERVVRVPRTLGPDAALLALAATAQHALEVARKRGGLPSLVVGHGVLGRLLARLTIANGGTPPIVWERSPDRRSGARGYEVRSPDTDERTDHALAIDASGDPSILDTVFPRLRRGGEVVLAGFYAQPVSFVFPPAFMKEAAISIAAEWQPSDLTTVCRHLEAGRLDLHGLITHRLPATGGADAYRQAFEDPDCLKLVLDWK